MNKYLVALSAAVLIGGNVALFALHKPTPTIKIEQAQVAPKTVRVIPIEKKEVLSEESVESPPTKTPTPESKPKKLKQKQKKSVKKTHKPIQEKRDTFWFPSEYNFK